MLIKDSDNEKRGTYGVIKELESERTAIVKTKSAFLCGFVDFDMGGHLKNQYMRWQNGWDSWIFIPGRGLDFI